jgi:hypothetical protein
MMPRILATAAALCAVLARTSEPQQLAYDAVSGNYRLTYYSDDLGREVTLTIEPPNKVDPRLELVSTQRAPDGRWEYRYQLANLTALRSTQSIGDFEIPCSPQAEAVAPTGWSVMVSDIDRSAGGYFCTWSELSGDGGVAPGSSLQGFVVRSSWLPAIAPGKFWGSAPPVMFPEGDGEHESAVHDLIKQVSGVRGGWVPGNVIAPAREPTGLSTERHLGNVQADMTQACGEQGLITNQGICTSLQGKLDQAAQAIRAGDASAARARLGTFLAELDAQRGVNVPENAYWLLWTNVQAVLSRL